MAVRIRHDARIPSSMAVSRSTPSRSVSPGSSRRTLPLGVTAAEASIRLDEQLLDEDRTWRAVSRSADFAEPYPVEFPPDTAD